MVDVGQAEAASASASAAEADAPTQSGTGPELDEGFAAGSEASDRPPKLTPRAALEFELMRSGAYHADRERFFDTVHRWTMFVVVLLGSAAFGDLLGQNRLLAGAVACAGLVDLVFDVSGKARAHAQLRRLSFEMLAALLRGDDENGIRARLTEGYGEEPNFNGTVNCVAYNAANAQLGRSRSDQFVIGAWRRRLRHFWPGADDLKTFRELGLTPPGNDHSPR